MGRIDVHVVDQKVSADGRSVCVLRQSQRMSKRFAEAGHHAGFIERGKSGLDGFLKRVLVQADDLVQTRTVDAQYELLGWLDELMMGD